MSKIIIAEDGNDQVEIFRVFSEEFTNEDLGELVKVLNSNPLKDVNYRLAYLSHTTVMMGDLGDKVYRVHMDMQSGDIMDNFSYYPSLYSFYDESFRLDGLFVGEGPTEKEALANCKLKFEKSPIVSNWDEFKKMDSDEDIQLIPPEIFNCLKYPNTAGRRSTFWERVPGYEDFLIRHKFTGKTYHIKNKNYSQYTAEEVELTQEVKPVLTFKRKA